MLLAAGRGERLRPITETCPKPLVEVRGKPLIVHHLEALARSGIDGVVVNLGWLGQMIAELVGSGAEWGLDVVYSPEGDNILETGGGIQRALPLLGRQPFLVVNADVYTDMPMPLTLDDDALGHLMLVPRPSHRDAGDFSIDGRRLSNREPRPLTFSGVAIYRPELFVDCEPGRFPLAPILRDAADRRQLTAEVWEGEWHDVGTPERLERLNR
jgi:MurNAc alpha-1-phosphate uridylyltransferase